MRWFPSAGVAALGPQYAARGARDVEAYLGQRPSEQAVELVAPAAPSSAYDLFEDAVDIQIERRAELHIQILVRNAKRLPTVELAQAFERRFDATLVADPIEIGLKFHEFAPAPCGNIASCPPSWQVVPTGGERGPVRRSTS